MTRETSKLASVVALWWLIFVGVPLLPAQDAAQKIEQGKIPTRSTSDINALDETLNVAPITEQLSKNRYSRRQQATIEMWSSRDELREQVQAAARHPDPEVAQRAKWVLRQWRRGAMPDSPPGINRLLQRSDDPVVIQELLELGQFKAVLIAVEESAEFVEFEFLANHISTLFLSRFPIYVRSAMEQDALPELLRLVDLVATTNELAVCRVRLMQYMEMPIAEDDLLPTSAKMWNAADRMLATVSVLSVLNRQDQAIEAARQSDTKDLLRVCQMLAGQWQALAADSIEQIENAKLEPSERLKYWVHAMIAADRCGDDVIEAKAIEALKQSTDETGRHWKTLALHGHVSAALYLLQAPETITDVAIAASRPEYAFDAIGHPIAEVDQKLSDWIEQAMIAEMVAEGDKQACMEIRKVLSLMRCLIAVGRDDTAWRIAEKLSDTNIEVGIGTRKRFLRDFVLQSLLSTSRSDWIIRLSVLEDEDSVSATGQWCMTRILPDTDHATFTLMLESILALKPSLSFQQRFRMACELLDGGIPADFDPNTDFDRLFRHLTKTNEVEQSWAAVAGRPKLNHNVVKFFARHGRSELAEQSLQLMAESGDVEALYELATRQANEGKIDAAESYFERVWKQVQRKGRGLGRSRTSDSDSLIAAKALIDEWFVARRVGDIEGSDRLRNQIEATLCSPSAEFLKEIAAYLSGRGELDLAKQVYDALLPLTSFESQQDTEFYDVARGFAAQFRQHDPEQAIRWFDLAVAGTLESVYYRSSAYVTLPLFVNRWRLEVAIDNKNAQLARQSLERIIVLDAMDITFTEDLLPKMREADMDDLPNEFFDHVFDRGKSYAAKFPFDATTANNLAWAAAMNDRRLDEALALSEQACFVEPDSAIFRDTLAEILFRLGRKQEALHVEESCVLDDPTQWHLHQQIEKYRAAVAELAPER